MRTAHLCLTVLFCSQEKSNQHWPEYAVKVVPLVLEPGSEGAAGADLPATHGAMLTVGDSTPHASQGPGVDYSGSVSREIAVLRVCMDTHRVHSLYCNSCRSSVTRVCADCCPPLGIRHQVLHTCGD